MNARSKMVMLIRREVWENRSFWIAPLVMAAVILFAAAFGGVHVGDGDEFFIGSRDGAPATPAINPGEGKLLTIYMATISGFTFAQLFTLGIVVFFYLLDSLLSERKDRSILFWKSMPISDSQVVSSKVITALVLAPIFVLLVSALTQLAFGLIWSLRDTSFPADMLIPWNGSAWLQVQAGFAALVPAVIVWYLPIAGYLLLVSVWARRNAFLWAVLPWAFAILVENLITHTNNFGDFLGRRFAGVFEVMDFERMGNSDGVPSLGSFLEHVGRVFVHPETWVSVVVAAAMFIAVIRIRRYRDDT
jgi:ABC-2 type transport system permease protein